MVERAEDRQSWIALGDRHYILVNRKPFGCRIRYFLLDESSRRVGCLLFEDCARDLPVCDRWIGLERAYAQPPHATAKLPLARPSPGQGRNPRIEQPRLGRRTPRQRLAGQVQNRAAPARDFRERQALRRQLLPGRRKTPRQFWRDSIRLEARAHWPQPPGLVFALHFQASSLSSSTAWPVRVALMPPDTPRPSAEPIRRLLSFSPVLDQRDSDFLGGFKTEF